MNNIISNLIRLSCPKCSLSILQDSFEQNEKATCKKCGHSFDWRKRWDAETVERFTKPFKFDGSKDIALSRDVYVGGAFDAVSIGTELCAGVHVGKISGNSFDNLVRDHHGYIQGKITTSGYFTNYRI